ncbi:unnamed protein product [Symbiodinium sp. KB8]|nr:unnamed protein product [Symbiodinium sp. KB8]
MASDSTPGTGPVESVAESTTLEKVDLSEPLAAWAQEQVKAEVARVAGLGSKCLPVPVVSCATDVEQGEGADAKIVHIVEAKTKFDFARVQQILLSAATPVPEELQGTVNGEATELALVFLVLLGDKPIPLLLPYLHAAQHSSALTEWCLVNSQGAGVRHHVEGFADVAS